MKIKGFGFCPHGLYTLPERQTHKEAMIMWCDKTSNGSVYRRNEGNTGDWSPKPACLLHCQLFFFGPLIQFQRSESMGRHSETGLLGGALENTTYRRERKGGKEAGLGRRRIELWCSIRESLSSPPRELCSWDDPSELSQVGARELLYCHTDQPLDAGWPRKGTWPS